MSKFESLKQFRDVNAEQKLAILRSEMLTPISAVRGFAAVIKEQVRPEVLKGLPDDFEVWIGKIMEAGDELKEILDILTRDQAS